jgi:hypothetical protein
MSLTYPLMLWNLMSLKVKLLLGKPNVTPAEWGSVVSFKMMPPGLSRQK